jgi:hypothetical protein
MPGLPLTCCSGCSGFSRGQVSSPHDPSPPLLGDEMKIRLFTIAFLTALFPWGVIALEAGAKPAAHQAKCQRFCLTVSPEQGKLGQVFTIRGRGWLPKRKVEALFGFYCPPGPCLLSRQIKRFRTTQDGRFMFQFENGPGSCGVENAGVRGGDGRGPVLFRQRGKVSGRLKTVQRTAHFSVDGQRL